MKLRELIELVQQHHPHIGETEAKKLLNRASDDFCAKTDVIDTSWTDTSIAEQRYYNLGFEVLKVRRVDVDGKLIPCIIGPVEETDID
tara:strand:+ start:1374 stop:1637 length:264 start_codon:yes stop_codon:yes gene_type:complete